MNDCSGIDLDYIRWLRCSTMNWLMFLCHSCHLGVVMRGPVGKETPTDTTGCQKYPLQLTELDWGSFMADQSEALRLLIQIMRPQEASLFNYLAIRWKHECIIKYNLILECICSCIIWRVANILSNFSNASWIMKENYIDWVVMMIGFCLIGWNAFFQAYSSALAPNTPLFLLTDVHISRKCLRDSISLWTNSGAGLLA